MQKVFTVGGTTNFKGLFLVPMFVATAAAVALALFFHPPKTAQSGAASAPAH
jgi:hypothetical protein